MEAILGRRHVLFFFWLFVEWILPFYLELLTTCLAF